MDSLCIHNVIEVKVDGGKPALLKKCGTFVQTIIVTRGDGSRFGIDLFGNDEADVTVVFDDD